MAKSAQQPSYQRILLKFSGEALMGKKGFGIDCEVIEHIAREIKPVLDLKVQVGVIIGGGNFFRGSRFNQEKIDRITVDQMGMAATLINALAMRDVFEHTGIATKVLSAISVAGVSEVYDRSNALSLLKNNFVVIFAGGTGIPLVTTDTALSLRGIELKADILLKATNVDGIYSADPVKNSTAKLFHHLSYQEILTKELAVMDMTAFYLCRDHNMRLRVFNMHKPGALLRVVLGADEGTLVER
ncbi:MAG: UMP kinase [Gammaproteobacteria bacterium]|nr:UMP kinase [Gammaproteobacteria bacterium]